MSLITLDFFPQFPKILVGDLGVYHFPQFPLKLVGHLHRGVHD